MAAFAGGQSAGPSNAELSLAQEIGSPTSADGSDAEMPLDEEAAQILGDEPGASNSDAADLHPTVLRRWGPILHGGLSTDDRDALLGYYPVVSFTETSAPDF